MLWNSLVYSINIQGGFVGANTIQPVYLANLKSVW